MRRLICKFRGHEWCELQMDEWVGMFPDYFWKCRRCGELR